MARGDFVGDIVSVGASSFLDISISAGDEVVIKAWATDSAGGDFRLHISDGTPRCRFGTAAEMISTGMTPLTIPCNENNMIGFRNNHGSNAYPFYYAGYKTKE